MPIIFDGTKPRLVVVVGAGASIKAGAPSVRAITDAVRSMLFPKIPADLGEFYRFEHGVPRITPELRGESLAYPAIKLIERGVAQIVGADYNFEHLLHAVETLEPYVAADTYDPKLLQVRPMIAAFTDADPRFRVLMNYLLLLELRYSIVERIRDVIIHEMKPVSDPIFDRIDQFVATLDARFTLDVFNLNYDDSLERRRTWEDGFGPVSEGFVPFDRARYTNARDIGMNLMSHMHGSIYYGYVQVDPQQVTRESGRGQLVRFATLDAAASTLRSLVLPTYTDGQIDDPGPIISGASKMTKLVAAPYNYYYAGLQSAVQRSRRFLFLGYGFNDPHLNRWFIEAIRHHGPKNVRCAVIDYRPPGEVCSWPLVDNAAFSHLYSVLSNSEIDFNGIDVREFDASGNFALSGIGFPARHDITERVVRWLSEE